MLKFNDADVPDLRLILVRHGQTDWNAEGRWQGQLDTPLNATGRAQAEAAGRALAQSPLAAIYASDLSRAWDTGQAIASHHKIDVTPEPLLREIALGDWQGLTYAQVEALDPDVARRWIAGEAMRSPGGEGSEDLLARAETVLHDMFSRHQGETVLWATHGGIVRMTLCLALGLPAGQHRRFRTGSTSITEIVFDQGESYLIRANDCHHLDEPGLPH